MNTNKMAQEIVKNDVASCLTTMVTQMVEGGAFYKYDEETEQWEEPLEFWDVSDWLKKKLRDKGENVVEEFGLNIWCRMTSGQAICMDYVIQDIAKEI
ncbi:hypothetical protein [Bathymodiolus japonicus methanotrophic gill symbiont]|uniref:hypothetical protein n=1 Tax=Bathymodiolus japonicus methanotrophic gill symbiont TaxID=113269 RepID=UPI001C8E78B7|nr:hypothetical protein [Bathymodiolus japonicus methanotrophic gill symbiont]